MADLENKKREEQFKKCRNCAFCRAFEEKENGAQKIIKLNREKLLNQELDCARGNSYLTCEDFFHYRKNKYNLPMNELGSYHDYCKEKRDKTVEILIKIAPFIIGIATFLISVFSILLQHYKIL